MPSSCDDGADGDGGDAPAPDPEFRFRDLGLLGFDTVRRVCAGSAAESAWASSLCWSGIGDTSSSVTAPFSSASSFCTSSLSFGRAEAGRERFELRRDLDPESSV
eukprot:m.192998 g.192998  ORF g.192998 m.192998 type:complete len:105 (-) comp18280_c3_seq1:236-550(-)